MSASDKTQHQTVTQKNIWAMHFHCLQPVSITPSEHECLGGIIMLLSNRKRIVGYKGHKLQGGDYRKDLKEVN